MSYKIRRINLIKPALIWILFFFLFIQIFGIVYGEENFRQIGKHDVTIYTSDVTNAGLDVPEEYQNDVAMIQFSDDEPIEGDTVIINATIFNVGTRSASVTVYFYDGPPADDDLIGIENLSINPLGFKIASTDWDTTAEDEFHTIYVLINPDDPANETNSDNNQATRDIIVNQIPIASAGIDMEGAEDDEIEFDGTGSTDTSSDLSVGLIYSWNFNDPFANESNPNMKSGNNLTRPTHIFTNEGVYFINLTVNDDGGARDFDSVKVVITNIPPSAEAFSSQSTVYEDSELILSSLQSEDTPSDKPLLKYNWDFGDGTKTGWVNRTSTSHSYTKKGSYQIIITVKDDNNLTDSDSLVVEVLNVIPTADAGPDQKVSYSNLNFNASSSTDTPSDLESLVYSWDFGDGESEYGKIVDHNYSKKGSYEVTLTVTDDDGDSDTDSIDVVIENLSPNAIITVSKNTAKEDEEIFFNATTSTDLDGTILSYFWDFGDGETGSESSTLHKYTKKGIYIVTLFVTDSNNAVNSDTVDIIIQNALPIADAGENKEAYVNDEISFDAGGSTDSESDIGLLEYRWDFGDNTTDTGITAKHTYDKEGIYEVILTVTDDDGDSAVTKIKVIVRSIQLLGINITADLDPTSTEPGGKVEVSGHVEFKFERPLIKTDITLTKLRIKLIETEKFWTVIPELNGDYSLEFNAPVEPGTYTVRVSITRLGLLEEETEVLTVVSPEQIDEKDEVYIGVSTIIIGATVIGAAGGLGAFFAGTDLGRYKFFTLLIPLYSKLNPNAILDNFTRGRIFEFIRMNPGQHYRGIKSTLGLNNGCLTYHLKVLERENMVQSRTDGTYKRFYPVGMKIFKGQPNNIQDLILEKIEDTPYITQKELADQIGIDVSTVNYHVNIMSTAGLIRSEKKGRTKHYYVEPEAEAIRIKMS